MAKISRQDAWTMILPQIAQTAGVKPGYVRLTRARIENGEDLQICVTGRGQSDEKHNLTAIRKAVAGLNGTAPAGPPLIVKHCSGSCLEHFGKLSPA